MRNASSSFSSLAAAMEDFESGIPTFPDYDWVEEASTLRTAPAPFRVVRYDTSCRHVVPCPSWRHDCTAHGCGTTWSSNTTIGLVLLDAQGASLREVGVVGRGGRCRCIAPTA